MSDCIRQQTAEHWKSLRDAVARPAHAILRRADRRGGADVALAARNTPARRRTAGAAEAEHRRHHGRRHRHLEHRRLPSRHDGRPHAEPRQDRRRGHAVHRLLRRGELHGGPRQLHHRRAADPHRHDHGRPGRRTDRPAGGRRRPSPRRSRRMGYATGQFGKNHLGDKNEFLPTVHGFDEFFGYLYHLDAMEDPCHPNYPQDLRTQSVRATWSTRGDQRRRRHRRSALGQGRQAEDRGRRNALSRSGWKPWTTKSATRR